MKKHLRKIGAILPKRLVVHIDHFRTYKRILDLKNPKYYGEKIQWIKLNANMEELGDLVDKYKVREFIEKRIGSQYLPKLYGVYKKSNEIDYKNLPNQFVLKINNGSGGNIICKDKNKLDIKVANQKLDKWLSEKFYKYTKEFQYKNVKSLIICEEYLEDESGSLRDYKLHCFKERVEYIEVHTDRFKNHKENYYYPNWTKADFRGKLNREEKNIARPKQLEQLILLAQKLSKGFEYVRVDFYIVREKIYFGELTFTPANGTDRLYPIEKDLEIAKKIDLEKYKIGLN